MNILVRKQIEFYLKKYDESTYRIVSGNVVFRISHIKNNHIAYRILDNNIKFIEEYLIQRRYMSEKYSIEYMEYMKGCFVIFHIIDKNVIEKIQEKV